MKRIAAALTLVAAVAGIVVPTAASAASVCVHAYVNVNGTSQTIDQCAP